MSPRTGETRSTPITSPVTPGRTLAHMPQAVYAPGVRRDQWQIIRCQRLRRCWTIFNTLHIYDIDSHKWTPTATCRTVWHTLGSAVFEDHGTGPKLYPVWRRYTVEPENSDQSLPRSTTRVRITNTWRPNGPQHERDPMVSCTAQLFGNDSIVTLGGENANIVGLVDNEQLISIRALHRLPRQLRLPRRRKRTSYSDTNGNSQRRQLQRPHAYSTPRPSPYRGLVPPREPAAVTLEAHGLMATSS